MPDDDAGDNILDILSTETAIAPAIWPTEIANSLLSATRRKRVSSEEALAILSFIAGYEVAVQSSTLTEIGHDVLPIARKHGLTVYDAAYVSLAKSEGAALLSLDRAMCAAAHKEGVHVVAL